jgi:hypothetical protein
MDSSKPRRVSLAVKILAVPIVALLLLFAPLLLAFLESITTGTALVECSLKKLGMYGFLDKIYSPLIDFIRDQK